MNDETPLSTLDLPTRVFNALSSFEIWTVEALRAADYRDLMQLRNIGKTSLRYIHQALGRTESMAQHQPGTDRAWRQHTYEKWHISQQTPSQQTLQTLSDRIEQIERRLADLEQSASER